MTAFSLIRLPGPHGPLNWKTNLLFVWLAQILTLAGYGAAMPFIPLFIRDVLGIASEHDRGFWVSMFYFFGMLSFCVSNPIWGMMADKYGRRLMLLRANFVTAFIFPCMALAPNIYVLILIRFIASAFSGTIAASQALIATATPDRHQGFAQGILSTAIWSGNMIGYLVGGLLMHYLGYNWAFLLCGVMYFVGGIIVLFFVQEDHQRRPSAKQAASLEQHHQQSARRQLHWPKLPSWQELPGLLRPPQFPHLVLPLMGICMLVCITRRFEEPYLAMLVEIVADPMKAAFHTGLICAAAAAGGILSGTVFGWLSDRLPPLLIMLPALMVSSLMLLLQGSATSLVMLGAARFGAYFTSGGLEPTILAVISRVTPPAKRATVFGWTTSARTLGMVLSAPLAGIFITNWGTRSVFYAAAALYILIMPAIIATMKKLPDRK
ncbi:MAG TPA: MFS transporter [Lentisphaeria bacterium]|nr:multidrug efflux MFS transporter [Lentisphaerota bacterium]OQC12042.1 MAG: Tetracycline resistance protein, class C [Lentisphaerae bacterium ADurb.Bin082]HPY90069.1 MFS transporter [Lentisphaeria bacterium]HQL87168.1 MFS transporter [Lentisphaeria bacterium]